MVANFCSSSKARDDLLTAVLRASVANSCQGSGHYGEPDSGHVCESQVTIEAHQNSSSCETRHLTTVF